MARDTPGLRGDSLPLPNTSHAGPGSNSGPDLGTMADGLKKGPSRTSRTSAARSRAGSSSRTRKWWKIRLFRGMVNDLRRRAPFYLSDWKDAWDYRVVPATVYMYFAKYVLPASRPASTL